ncbi:MAG: succinylglutamate desuccinylase/aspartoacylase family protein [Tunicatimonas sp.]|uniref:succinylglutamate desuccinylase/aspartoacylase family protein n=1 Tax=Tunicatimonas sp. TaxID=1940096 RepID=UPI003C70D3DE
MKDRTIGHLTQGRPGPLIILIGGLHGNEIEGVRATERVFEQLKNYTINGEVIGLRGNLAAIAQQRRYLAYDLNRCWTEAHLRFLRSDAIKHSKPEDQEAIALLKVIDHYAQQSFSTKIIADLHTTSAQKGSFVIVPEHYAEHPVIKALHIPIVVNMEYFLKGTLLNYSCDRGFISFAFEGGQIGSLDAIDLHEAGIWSMLLEAGAIENAPASFKKEQTDYLQQLTSGLPNRVTAKSMHVVHEGAKFSMNDGYFNFKPVQKGEVLAQDKNGPIVSPQDGLIFMPLYQKEGSDGFFIVDLEE